VPPWPQQRPTQQASYAHPGVQVWLKGWFWPKGCEGDPVQRCRTALNLAATLAWCGI